MLCSGWCAFAQAVSEGQVRMAVRQVIARAAARHGVDSRLADAVARVESGYKPNVVSAKGAMGVMQLMPTTARGLGVDAGDAVQNIEGGVRHLKVLLQRYGGDVVAALSAYNAGPGAVERYGGVPPYAETQGYVRAVLSNLPGGAQQGARPAVKSRAPSRKKDRCWAAEVQEDASGRAFRIAAVPPPGCEALR